MMTLDDLRYSMLHVRRAFASMGVAIASTLDREQLATLPRGYAAEAVQPALAERLQDAVANGDIFCFKANPQPFTQITLTGTFRSGSDNPATYTSMWGLWVGKKASWRGTREPPKRLSISREEAIAKDIPMPDETTEQPEA